MNWLSIQAIIIILPFVVHVVSMLLNVFSFHSGRLSVISLLIFSSVLSLLSVLHCCNAWFHGSIMSIYLSLFSASFKAIFNKFFEFCSRTLIKDFRS